MIKSGEHDVLREARKDYTYQEGIHNGKKPFKSPRQKRPYNIKASHHYR
jgi:hypothetical protein